MKDIKHPSNRHPRKAATYHHGDLRRSLVQAALELAAEGRDWNFSLREVARRAGVSHNAPYGHFAHKRDLLAAAAAAGDELLQSELIAALGKVKNPLASLLRMGAAYINFGTKNAALYRLMFTAVLVGPDWRPEQASAPGVATRALLEDILGRGARSGVFAPALNRKSELQIAALHAWAAVHGLTMLLLDGLATVENLSSERMARRVLTTISRGLEAGR